MSKILTPLYFLHEVQFLPVKEAKINFKGIFMKLILILSFLFTANLFAEEMFFKGTRTDSKEILNCTIIKSIEYGEEYFSVVIEPTKEERHYYTFFNNLGVIKFGPFPIGSLKKSFTNTALEIHSKNDLNFYQNITSEKKFFSEDIDSYMFSYLKMSEENKLKIADSNSISFRVVKNKVTQIELRQSIQEFVFRGPLKYHRSICRPN